MKRAKAVVVGVIAAAGVAGMSMAQTNELGGLSKPAVKKSWADSITVKGDLRYRYETIGDDSALDANKHTYTRQRDRIRARIGADAKVNDDVKATIRLATDAAGTLGGETTSRNQTLGDGDVAKPIWLDQAFLDWNFFGENTSELHGLAGKMPVPFLCTPTDDLIWKVSDITPEGLAAKGQIDAGMATVFANGAYLWVQERNSLDAEMCYAGQLAAKMVFAPEFALTFAASYYDFQNVKGADVIDWQGLNKSYGNSTTKGSVSGTTTNKAWATGFTPAVYHVQADTWLGTLPISVFAQMISNGDASKNKNGQVYGLTVGKAKNPDTFEVGYSYAKLEQDATIGMWTDSDRWGGGTDGKGHRIYAKYQMMKNLQAGVTYLKDDKTISDPAKTKDYDRLQIDLVATF